MAKAGDKSGGSGKKSYETQAATEEAQEAAVGEDGTTESGVQPPKTAAFPQDSAFRKLRTNSGDT